MIVEMLLKALREREEKKAREFPDYVHCSELGSCSLAVALRLTGNKPHITDEKLLTLSIGIAQHSFFTELLHLPEPQPMKDDSLRLAGQADHIYGNTILEYKTISTWAFKSINAPYNHHIIQVYGYMHLYGCKTAEILYINKDTGGVKEFEVKAPHNIKELIESKIREIRDCERELRRGVVPITFQAREDWQCKYCFFKNACPCPLQDSTKRDE